MDIALITNNGIPLLVPTNRPERNRKQPTIEGAHRLPYENQNRSNERQKELDKLIHLIQILLRGDVVLPIETLLLEMQLRCEVDVRGEEGYKPDAKDLRNGDVEDDILGVIGWTISTCVYVEEELKRTDRINLHVNARGQDLVPPVDGADEEARVGKVVHPAEGMREGCIVGEVLLDHLALL